MIFLSTINGLSSLLGMNGSSIVGWAILVNNKSTKLWMAASVWRKKALSSSIFFCHYALLGTTSASNPDGVLGFEESEVAVSFGTEDISFLFLDLVIMEEGGKGFLFFFVGFIFANLR